MKDGYIRCPNCTYQFRIRDIIKLKDRFCCPRCFKTIKIKKEKAKEE